MKTKRPDLEGNQQGLYKRNRAILKRTADTCAICGKPLDKEAKAPDPRATSIDHIIPVSKGGRSTMDNLQATHLGCNKMKGNKLNFNIATQVIPFKSFPQYVDWRRYKSE